ncbi:MAG TPA: LPS export ABC transporter periplasmic protein LptC [Candidatus Methylomirabilis sp.]|nr:LPS export ABC transporter periplasmic protein LptC [Candidatus Methylomirabilis sp.]
MRRSQAARYARWSAALALLLACITAGVYLKRGWQRVIEQKKAPPPPPVNVEKQSSALAFSKMDGPRKIFTVEASKSTDFKDREASVIENVKVTIFGQAGDRHDTIRTQSCQYAKDQSAVICSGAVQLDLQSAADAERAAKNPSAASQIVHIETRGVTFDRATGAADTTQPVTFSFPNGSGTAVGARYSSDEGTLRLLRNVRLNLAPPPPKATANSSVKPGTAESVEVTGASLDFGRDEKTIHIAGPAEARSKTARLTAGELTLELDQTFRARRLLAVAGLPGTAPEVTSQSSSGPMTIDAEKLTALFAPEGWVARLDASGNVRGFRRAEEEDDEFHADATSLDLWPRVNQAKELNLSGGVLLKTSMNKTGDTRVLQTGALRIEFSEGKDGRSDRPTNAETLTAGSMEWTDNAPQAKTAPVRTKLQADKLQLAFGEEGRAKQLDAHGNVQIERGVAGRPIQTASAKAGAVQLLAAGGWSQMDLQGGVNLKEAERSAQADHATFFRAAQTAVLTGNAVARDAATETHAPRLVFTSTTGEMRAEGGVRFTDFSPNGGATRFAQEPANITADAMQGNSKTGRALYTGHGRLWQGDSVLEADSVELLRTTRILNAAGNVRAVFPQTPALPTSASTQTVAVSQIDASSPTASQASSKKPVLWHISSGWLTYSDAADTAHLEKNVIVQSPDQRIRAPQMDLYFIRGSQSATSSSRPSATAASNAQQISRAVGKGGVTVEQGGRRAVAERGEYTAADGKFVMTGGNPTLYDGSSGTTTGRQLTFFLADDTIIVDSENGSRTLTKHRVEK